MVSADEGGPGRARKHRGPSGDRGKRRDNDIERVVTSNRRARRDYEIIETLEAGMVLFGSEVKSLRRGNAHLKDAYAAIEKGEVWLINSHVAPYPPAGKHQQHNPDRRRKLLLSRREIDHLYGRVAERGFTLVPLRIYFRGGLAKVELAVARGKKVYDKREQIRREAVDREIAQELRRRR